MATKMERAIDTQVHWHVGDRVERVCAEHPGQHRVYHPVLREGVVTRVGWTRVEVRWDNGMVRNYATCELTHVERKENA